MKIDLHVHSGFSVCASADYKTVVNEYSEKGISFVLCNHYNALYTAEYGGAYSKKDYADSFIEEFYLTRALGEKKGIKVFFGIEVAICMPDCPYAEFLIYGAQPRFLLDNPFIYNLSQKELFELTNKNNLVLVQAHPFRKEQGHFPHDCNYVHGVEINCHYRFLREEDKVRALANRYNLFVTCGSDYHGKNCGAGGIECSEIYNESELKDILFNRDYKIFMR